MVVKIFNPLSVVALLFCCALVSEQHFHSVRCPQSIGKYPFEEPNVTSVLETTLLCQCKLLMMLGARSLKCIWKRCKDTGRDTPTRSGVRTRDPSNWTAVDRLLIPHRHRDRICWVYTSKIYYLILGSIPSFASQLHSNSRFFRSVLSLEPDMKLWNVMYDNVWAGVRSSINSGNRKFM